MAVMHSRPNGRTCETRCGVLADRQSGMSMVPSHHIDDLADAEQVGMRRITALLVDEFGGRYGSGVIEQFVSEFLDEMSPTATITTYLPLLAERSVRDRIRTRSSRALPGSAE